MKLSNLLKKQKHLKKSKAFTLVELIVVITIIAILWTIAFIALQWYTQNSRDSKRISDINSIQKSLEIYIAEKGTYPIPDNYENIIYSGSTAWIEWTIWDKVIKNLDKINKKPLDPLTGNEYTYSVTSWKTEYQIWAISEWGQMWYKLPINQTHAASKKEAKAMIRWNYNERFLKVQSWTLNWILALPSIIATDITTPEIQTILDNKKLVYNNYSNIPHSYNNYWYTMTGWFNYTNPNPLIYSGSTKTLADDNEEKLLFVDSLKEAYNWTILQLESNYQDIVNADTENNETWAINLINNFINTNVW
jgi:prepilin-type N-terminal cleavage/methylation domain-containing protein